MPMPSEDEIRAVFKRFMENEGPITDDILEEMNTAIQDKEIMARLIMCHEVMSRQSIVMITRKGVMCALQPDDLEAVMEMIAVAKQKIVEDMKKQHEEMGKKIDKYKD